MPGSPRRSLIDLVVERLKLFGLVTGVLRVEVHDDAVLCLHSEVLILKFIQALRHQTCADQKHQ